MDIAILISKYLEGKEELRDYENDSFNIVNGSIFRWDFANIPCPTMEELEALNGIVEAEQSQQSANVEAQSFLDNTDWKVLRHRDQQELGLPTSLTAQEFFELLQQRQQAREVIVK